MKLAIKFNAILIATLAAGWAIASLAARSRLLDSARSQVSQQARLMMETTSSTRRYTSEHIRPILDKYQQHGAAFYPESVPAFSATRMFGYLRDTYPDYNYREATLNPTNPSDRAVDWEARIVDRFRNSEARQELTGEQQGPNGPLLYLARPIRTVESCLECHSVPSAAPAAMVSIYGTDNGFGWKLHEVVGAQIVTVPLAVPQAMAKQDLVRFEFGLLVFLLVLAILLNVALQLTVIRPLAQVAGMASELSGGNLEVAELPAVGRDEVAALAGSLNRIARLMRALKSLGQ